MAIKGGYEAGALGQADMNRYWQIRFSKFDLWFSGQNWPIRLFWYFATLVTFIPLLISAGLFARRLSSKNCENREEGILPFRLFTGVYPGCVYSPYVKAYELELFKKCKFQEPILEIGIGDGYFSSHLLKAVNKRAYCGADLMYGALKSARRYGHCDNYVIMDTFEIPFPNGSLGTVFMNNLMHHLPSRSDALKEVLRVLRKGGRLIFTDNTEGWGAYTWEQLLLRKMRLNGFADKILLFKLRLLAQKLVSDVKYYEKKSSEMGYNIVQRMPFVSKQAMFLSSLFEFLNLKQGQPTRPEMKHWLRFFGCRKRIDRYMEEIVACCYRTDQVQCGQDGYAFELFEIEKTMGGKASEIKRTSTDFVCPKCKRSIVKEDSSFFCKRCEISYPVFDGIPIFLSYQQNLKGLKTYLSNTREEKVKEYIT